MGVGSVLRAGLGDWLHATKEPVTAPSGADHPVHSLFSRPREMPLPLSPLSVLRSLVQLQDLQALLWAWLIVGLLVLIAYCTSPAEASFKPFLTDFIFRERLRVLHNDNLTALASPPSPPNGSSLSNDAPTPPPATFGYLAAPRYSSTSPFALAFKSKVSLCVRTPPYSRKDLGLFSIVTISHSMPLYQHHEVPSTRQQAKSFGTSQHTSVFVGAFGNWWTFGYGVPDRVVSGNSSNSEQLKQERVELEENRQEPTEWGVLDMQTAYSEVESPSVSAHQSDASDAGHDVAAARRSSTVPTSRPPSPVTSHETIDIDEAVNDDVSLADLVAQSQAEVVDLQEQLDQIKFTSSRACEALETDLEDIRSKKRDEEKARSEIKARTKALDDSKRQVEGNRRDAERRLKAANTAISLKQNTITNKKELIDNLYKRQASLADKTRASTDRRAQRSQELATQIRLAEERTSDLKTEIASLHQQVSEAQQALDTEKVNLHAAYDLAQWRDTHKLDPQMPAWTNLRDQDPALAYLPFTQDPLVSTLSRMEEYGQHPDMYATNRVAPVEGYNEVTVPDKRSRGLGASVLRNAFRRATAGVGPESAGRISESASLQSVSDFEAIKQAFQPTVASDEDGRRSWSAFDMWQSDIRGGAQHRMQWAENAGNASADSLPHFAKSSDFYPLDRSTSAGADPKSIRDQMALSDAEHLRNVSKVKRAFRWPFRPTPVQEDVA